MSIGILKLIAVGLVLTCTGCDAYRTHTYFYPPADGGANGGFALFCDTCPQSYQFPLMNGGGGGK